MMLSHVMPIANDGDDTPAEMLIHIMKLSENKNRD